ncbi:ANL_collapsed_G0029770.mRNA.1.CDS.1 [Saccharomyces cerevisiae]|nr:ANL_collapsed_G0029770.mRNA.1.CDS.1 [Saccharomyces cerevisiae]
MLKEKLSKDAENHKAYLKSHQVHRHKLKEMEKEEPLLNEDKERTVLFPIKYHEIWQAYKRAEASFWTAEEIDLSKDIHDWNNRMNENERFSFPEFLPFSPLLTVLLMKTWLKTSPPKSKFQRQRVSTVSNHD